LEKAISIRFSSLSNCKSQDPGLGSLLHHCIKSTKSLPPSFSCA
jgi:hypothetical protein